MIDPVIRKLTEADLAAADRINREAFGTFFGLENPMDFRGDGDVVRGRFRANPDGAFAADLDGELVACGFVMDWGSVGIFGPLTVDVKHWGKGIARTMMDEMVGYMDAHGFALQGLFTHPQSAKHIRLYEEYGFRMQRITAVMDRQVDLSQAMPPTAVLYSSLGAAAQRAALEQCRTIAGSIQTGLDLSREIQSIAQGGFGDTVLLRSEGQTVGFACCHQGAGSEAGSGQTVVKFACVAPGAAARFARLVEACACFSAQRGTARLVAGTNTGRSECYEALMECGFRTWMNGVAMIRPAADGYNLPGIFAIDDWR